MKETTFTLKTMAFARMLAEAITMICLTVLPIVLILMHKFFILPMIFQFVLGAAAIISLLLLPLYGFITWKVKVDDQGIATIALFKKQFCKWNEIRGLTRRTTKGWQRYVIERENDEMNFPVLLDGCDGLVQLIRAALPQGAAPTPYRKFSQDAISIILQLANVGGGLVLLIIFWMFCASLMHLHNKTDLLTLLAFCVVLTIALVWRTLVVVLMPKSIELTQSGIVLQTLFFEKRMDWSDIRGTRIPFPILPEGFMLNTKHGSFLVGSGVDASDELKEAIVEHVSTHGS